MYEFERLKGESITAYRAFIKYREGNINLNSFTKKQQARILVWKNQWLWDDRKNMYDQFLKSNIKDNTPKANQVGLQKILLELRTTLAEKIRLSDTEELNTDNLAKLISVISKAITDIIKTEREITTQTKDHNDWGELADKIRNNPEAMKLAEELSDLLDI